MPEFRAELSFEKLDEIVRIYDERGRRVFHELAPAIAEAMHSEVLEVFDTEGYGEWEPFADSTLERRMHGPRGSANPKLLQDTGVLAGTLQENTEDDLVEVYSNVPYAIYHVSDAPRKKLPKRDFLAIDEVLFEADVVSMIELRLNQPIAAE